MGNSIGVSFLIGATLGASVSTAFSGLQERIRATQQSMRNSERQSKKLAEVNRLRQKRDDALAEARRIRQSGGTINEDLARKIRRLGTAFSEAAREANVYGRSAAEVEEMQRRLAGQIGVTESRLRRMNAIQAERDNRSNIISQMRETLAPAAAVAIPVKLAIDFESVMADVKKVTDFEPPEFEKFSRDMLDLSTRLPMAAKGLAEIAAAAGQSGIAQEELLTFVEDAAKMGVAFDISASEAGSAMTGLRNNFKLTQDGVRLLGDSMNALANTMDAKAADIVNFANRAGGTASVYGFTGQQVAALGAAFLDCKVDAEAASTATNSMLTKLGTASILPDRAKLAMEKLGLSAQGIEKAFKKDAQGALLSFLQVVKSSKDPMMALSEIFGAEHAPKIVRLMNNLGHYEEALNRISSQKNYQGSMGDEYAVCAETTANNIQLLQNTISKLGITIGSVLLPPLNTFLNATSPVISSIADFARENEGLTKGVMMLGGGLVGIRISALAFRFMASLGKSACLQVGGALAGARRALQIPWPFGSIRNGLRSIGREARRAAQRMRELGPAGVAAGVGAKGLKLLGGAMKGVGAAFKMAFGPVSLLMMGLSFGVDYVIEHWDQISPFFSALWEGVKGIFISAWEWIKPIVEKVGGAVSTVVDGAKYIANGIGNVGGAIKSGFTSVVNWATGKKEEENLVHPEGPSEGPSKNIAPHGQSKTATQSAPELAGATIPSAAAAMPEPVAEVAPRMMSKEEFLEVAKLSPKKAAPEQKKKSKKKSKKKEVAPEIAEEDVSAADAPSSNQPTPARAPAQPDMSAFMAQMQQMMQQNQQQPQQPAQPEKQIIQPQVQVQLSVTQNGIPEASFASGVMNAIKSRQGELEQMISAIVNEQARLAYG